MTPSLMLMATSPYDEKTRRRLYAYRPRARAVAREFLGNEETLRALLGRNWASKVAKVRRREGEEALLA